LLEGFNPRPDFDTLYYLASNPDVAKAGINPFIHYLLHGREEGRLSEGRMSGIEALRSIILLSRLNLTLITTFPKMKM
jgi:hypothetical protein